MVVHSKTLLLFSLSLSIDQQRTKLEEKRRPAGKVESEEWSRSVGCASFWVGQIFHVYSSHSSSVYTFFLAFPFFCKRKPIAKPTSA